MARLAPLFSVTASRLPPDPCPDAAPGVCAATYVDPGRAKDSSTPGPMIIPQGRRWERMLLRMAQHCSGLLTSAASEFGKREELQAVMSVLHSWNSRVVGSSDRLKELLQSRADWAAIKICPLDAMKIVQWLSQRVSGFRGRCTRARCRLRRLCATDR